MQRGPSWVSWLPFFPTLLSTTQLENRTTICNVKKRTHNIYVTKLVEPKVINRVGRSHKVTFSELLIGLRGGNVELV